jgi:hypothetical protein
LQNRLSLAWEWSDDEFDGDTPDENEEAPRVSPHVILVE